MAERYGSLLRRRLCSADRLSDWAMAVGSASLKTPGSRSSALLVSVTWRDQYRGCGVAMPVPASTARAPPGGQGRCTDRSQSIRLLMFVVLRKHAESMYVTCFAQSPDSHDPFSTPRIMSLHQPSTCAEREFGRF